MIGPEVQVDAYRPASPYYTVGIDFADYWTAGLAHCMERFDGYSIAYHKTPSGGIGAFTVNIFPVFDCILSNVYVIASSNNGDKTISVGKEVAKVMMGEHSSAPPPFRFSCYQESDLHPSSNSSFPWS
jgi:hypothetical protein